MKTLKEIRDRVKTDTRETQLADAMVNDYINLTMQEINDPAWAFEQVQMLKGYNHLWTFNRRKYTLTVASTTEFYQLPRDLDKIDLIRQTSSPTKLRHLPDEVFYYYQPNPTATGNPQFYRLWEEEGVEVRLSTDDMLEILSSTTDTATVRIVGYDTDGLLRTESLTLNGTTAVAGTITYDAGKPLRVSKSANTTGVITIREKTADTVLVKLAPTETVARFKIIGFYPIPSSTLSIYIEYYTRIRKLEGDDDVPDIDEKWLWVVRLGAMAKVYQYQPKETLFTSTQAMYASGVRSMVKSDMQNIDYIPVLRSNLLTQPAGRVKLSDSVASGNYGAGYGLLF